MIPCQIDLVAILADLNGWGIRDYKIEAICGYSEGYISHVKAGRLVRMSYDRTARLYNFWFDERRQRMNVSRGTEPIQGMALTT